MVVALERQRGTALRRASAAAPASAVLRAQGSAMEGCDPALAAVILRRPGLIVLSVKSHITELSMSFRTVSRCWLRLHRLCTLHVAEFSLFFFDALAGCIKLMLLP